MKISIKGFLALVSVLVVMAAPAKASVVDVVDVVQAPTGYFVPTDSEKYNSPYYRWYNQDWSWKHSAYAGTVTSATLNISAFDIDFDSDELDEISVYSNGAWKSLGYLSGSDNSWAYTNFTLTPDMFGSIADGLSVMINIDTTHEYENWAVALAKSVLTINGESVLPPPVPSVPLPAALPLFAAGLGLLGVAGKRRKAKAAK